MSNHFAFDEANNEISNFFERNIVMAVKFVEKKVVF